MKESSNQKMQENKPVLELKNTEKKVCQELKWKTNISHCTLVYIGSAIKTCDHILSRLKLSDVTIGK